MRKIYHLASCDTCQGILKAIGAAKKGIELQEIKTDPIKPAELDAMKELSGSYEALFSRRAIKYRSMGLGSMELTEDDYRKLILEEYTFLKRPVAIIETRIFIGNTKEVVGALQTKLNNLP